MTSFLVVAGEASGDAHAAAVVREVERRSPGASFFGMGGERMRAEGVETLYDAKDVAVMGISEVLPRLPRILSALRGLARAARERRPAAALLVDLPDFNLRLAGRLKREGFRVIYYVSPMVWAWRPGRTRQIAAVVDRLLCIYPFEEPFLRERGVAATYVGNPLIDEPPPAEVGTAARGRLGLDPDLPTLALLPGSRSAEIERLFPTMLEATERLAADSPLQALVPVASTIDESRLAALAAGRPFRIFFRHGRTLDLLAAADAVLVASGTATLEALLANRPMVVVYRVSWLSWIVARLFVRVAHVALVNLLAGRRLVPELLQGALTPGAAAEALRAVWRDAGRRADILAGYRDVREKLGGPGASGRVAEILLEGRP
ncbi:MAG: lipid-A-disaccharide synthase [Myxococcales bacterium]